MWRSKTDYVARLENARSGTEVSRVGRESLLPHLTTIAAGGLVASHSQELHPATLKQIPLNNTSDAW
jgi:hypothetical protein